MTFTNIAPNFAQPTPSIQEREMTVEQRAQSLFLLERIPHKLFGENSQPKQPVRDV
jgi:hypothetical protein